MLTSLPLKIKLFILAGVPVIGALLLAYLVASDAQQRLASARALGSIEDLARLATAISDTVDALQGERAATALALGEGADVKARVANERRATDGAGVALSAFLASRDTSQLPNRLAVPLNSARQKLEHLSEVRTGLDGVGVRPDAALLPIDAINSDLVGATAALTGLSNDGEMLRNISALVTVMQLQERASQEQALLGYVFAKKEYPPGSYKVLVNLVTEQEVFDKVLRQSTSDDLVVLYDGKLKTEQIERAQKLRQVALDTMDDEFGVDVREWVTVQTEKHKIFRDLTSRLNERVKDAALAKIAEARRSVAVSRGLSGSVLLVSVLLAVIISLGISRSVGSLVNAAHDVQTRKDFSVRAKQVSKDELGRLTVAFNEMLDGLQARDLELEDHRKNLEGLVSARTAELAKRNAAMRIVLDNVDQGLATIMADGSIDAERSAVFDSWFQVKDASFAGVLASNDNNARDMLLLGWDGVTEGFMPRDVALQQMPKHLLREGRHYQLTYKLMGNDETLDGALLMVTDITGQIEQRRKEAEQRELIAVFESVMSDKSGFIEFFNETEKMVEEVVADTQGEVGVVKRLIHTIKGNTAIYGVQSVANVCHEVESVCIEEDRRPNQAERDRMAAEWSNFSTRVRLFANEAEEDVVEVQYNELERLLTSARKRAPHDDLVRQLEALRDEPTQVRLVRIGEQAKRLCKRLGKPTVRVQIESGDIRLPADRWGEFWSSFIHVVRNALDHGIESGEERVHAGKAESGGLVLRTLRKGDSYVVEMTDDGRGIDWNRVADKAKAAGLPYGTREALVEALFTDGVSTRDAADELSGRGVGMSAVREACRKLGGEITVVSTQGKGTTIRCSVPVVGNDRPSPQSIHPGARPSIRPARPNAPLKRVAQS